jgi:Fic family protein
MNIIPKINPSFDSKLTSVLFELERLRYHDLEGSTAPWLFFDLKDIMHLLESIASARIEGNHTTLVSAANDVIENKKTVKSESINEIRNIRNGIKFIEDNVNTKGTVTLGFIRELHKIAVRNLTNDGSKTPGKFRMEEVKINKSNLKPPLYTEIPSLMQELVDYINQNNEPQLDIIKTAIAHHRFTAIHPFDNGNGRTARLLTYAMLAKQKFVDDHGMRLLNPSSIFCIDRQNYYNKLSLADTYSQEGLEEWCLYVAEGIQNEANRVSRLLDKDFAVNQLLTPALKRAYTDKYINDEEYAILCIAMEKNIFQAQDIRHLFGISASAGTQASRVLANMREKKLIMVHPKFSKKYVIRFSNNYLLRGVLDQMSENGLLPITNEPNDKINS